MLLLLVVMGIALASLLFDVAPATRDDELAGTSEMGSPDVTHEVTVSPSASAVASEAVPPLDRDGIGARPPMHPVPGGYISDECRPTWELARRRARDLAARCNALTKSDSGCFVHARKGQAGPWSYYVHDAPCDARLEECVRIAPSFVLEGDECPAGMVVRGR